MLNMSRDNTTPKEHSRTNSHHSSDSGYQSGDEQDPLENAIELLSLEEEHIRSGYKLFEQNGWNAILRASSNSKKEAVKFECERKKVEKALLSDRFGLWKGKVEEKREARRQRALSERMPAKKSKTEQGCDCTLS